MIIVDSSVWIDYLHDTENAETLWLEKAMGHEAIGLTSLILCEVLQGIRDERQFRLVQRQLLDFPVFEIPATALAIAAAKNYRLLKERGVTIRKSIDCLIATFCITEGHSLLHRDRDFDSFALHLGLTIIPASGASHR